MSGAGGPQEAGGPQDAGGSDGAAENGTRAPIPDGAFTIPVERLPPGFAERVDSPPRPPVEPRPAATVVLLRQASAGPETLLLRRHRASGFVPGAYVFPGGRVDPEDAAAALGEWARGVAPVPAPEYWLAAAREAFEETGVLLARSVGGGDWLADAQADATLARWRERLLGNEATLLDMLRALDARLDLRRMVYCAHWITPEAEPRRYDTRFFVAELPPGRTVGFDAREMTDAQWLTPAAALERFQAGALPMVFPTVRTLESLARFDSVAETLRELRSRPVRGVLPRLVRTVRGVTIVTGDED